MLDFLSVLLIMSIKNYGFVCKGTYILISNLFNSNNNVAFQFSLMRATFMQATSGKSNEISTFVES